MASFALTVGTMREENNYDRATVGANVVRCELRFVERFRDVPLFPVLVYAI